MTCYMKSPCTKIKAFELKKDILYHGSREVENSWLGLDSHALQTRKFDCSWLASWKFKNSFNTCSSWVDSLKIHENLISKQVAKQRRQFRSVKTGGVFLIIRSFWEKFIKFKTYSISFLILMFDFFYFLVNAILSQFWSENHKFSTRLNNFSIRTGLGLELAESNSRVMSWLGLFWNPALYYLKQFSRMPLVKIAACVKNT